MGKTVHEKAALWDKDQRIIDLLLEDGFVHVTGLTTKKRSDDEPATISQGTWVKKHGEVGGHGYNNGFTAVVTPNGFYFLKMGHLSRTKFTSAFMETINYDGSDIGVFCSNGDTMFSNAILDRIANPLSEDYGNPFYEV